MNHSDVNIKLTKTCTTCANVNKTAPLVFQRNILTKHNLICDKVGICLTIYQLLLSAHHLKRKLNSIHALPHLVTDL